MSLIFLTYCYPPQLNPRAIQISRMVKYMGKAPHIFCCGDEADITDGDVKVTYIQQPGWEKLLIRVMNKFCPAMLQRPDENRIWAQRATKRVLKEARPTKDDVLVTFLHPPSDHFAGLQIKERTGAKWIACFSDPFVDNPFVTYNDKAFVENLEKQVVEKADRLVFTSQETIDLVMKKYPEEFRSKCRILEHSYAEAHLELKETLKAHKNEKLTIRHLGNLYKNRSPLPLIEALIDVNKEAPDLLHDVTFDFVGHVEMADQLQPLIDQLPEGLITLSGSVPYDESLKLMHQADILLLIEAPITNSVFLPSKLVEYLGAEKPVLSITPKGTGYRVTKEVGGFVSDIQNHAEIVQTLKDIFANREKFSASAEKAGRFHPQVIADTMNAILGELGKT